MMSDIRFKDFEDVLAMAGSMADAAEAHGSLCGALCSMAPYKMQDWINEILPDGAALSPESAAMIERVFTATATSFGEQGMEFEPLLPDDEQPLNGRANALALWCTGFLYGLGTGHISDLEALKAGYRKALDRAGALVRDGDAVVEEGAVAFTLNIELSCAVQSATLKGSAAAAAAE